MTEKSTCRKYGTPFALTCTWQEFYSSTGRPSWRDPGFVLSKDDA